jgi:hypothetical protein
MNAMTLRDVENKIFTIAAFNTRHGGKSRLSPGCD